MTRSRRIAWLRDELILALALFDREGPSPPRQSIAALSGMLRSFPIERELASDPRFRSESSVNQKIGNFQSLATGGRAGLTHGGKVLEPQVWAEFADDPTRLQEAAAAIQANLSALPSEGVPDPDELGISEASEGTMLTRLHIVRERNRKLVKSKKDAAQRANGNLACECCGFDFEARYGSIGTGFVECHHRCPVSTLRPGQVTRLADLALVCSNCHRMIHRPRPWLTVEEVATLLAGRAAQ